MAVFESQIKSLPRIGKGKVRDIYAVGDDKMLIVVSDRLSAFDVVMSDPIPDKGRVLNAMSNFWFARLAHIVPNHLNGAAPESAEEFRLRVRDLPIGALGSGSDFTPFLQHLGVAALNLGFGGEDDGGIYHSIYDDFYFYTRFLDTDFAYGRALAQTVGTAVIRLAASRPARKPPKQAISQTFWYTREVVSVMPKRTLAPMLNTTTSSGAISASITRFPISRVGPATVSRSRIPTDSPDIVRSFDSIIAPNSSKRLPCIGTSNSTRAAPRMIAACWATSGVASTPMIVMSVATAAEMKPVHTLVDRPRITA